MRADENAGDDQDRTLTARRDSLGMTDNY